MKKRETPELIGCPDIGANCILLEGKYLYNIIDDQCDFSDYQMIIFPDEVLFDQELSDKAKEYLRKTWQGEVVWADRKETQRFRSVLELLNLMESALDLAEADGKEKSDFRKWLTENCEEEAAESGNK